MKPQTLSLITTGAACLAAGIGIGVWLKPGRQAELSGSRSAPGRLVPVPDAGTVPGVPGRGPRSAPERGGVPLPTDTEPWSEARLSAVVAAIPDSGDDFLGLVESMAALTRVPDAQLEAMLAGTMAADRPGHAGLRIAQMYLASRFGRAFGVAGVDKLKAVMPAADAGTIGRVLGEAAAQEPDAALAFLRSGGKIDPQHAAGVISGIARTDPVRAAGELMQMPEALRTHPESLRALGHSLTDPAKGETVLAVIRQNLNPEQARVAMASMAEPLLWKDALALGTWLNGRKDPDGAVYAAIAPRIIDHLGGKPAELLKWSAGAPAGELRDKAVARSLQAVVKENPANASTVYAALPAQDQPAALRALSPQLAGKDIAAWQGFVNTLPPVDRHAAQAAGFSQWAARDEAGAGSWLQALPPGQEKDRHASDYAKAIVKQDPAAAAAWVRSITDPGTQRTAAEGAIRAADGNLETAVEIITEPEK